MKSSETYPGTGNKGKRATDVRTTGVLGWKWRGFKIGDRWIRGRNSERAYIPGFSNLKIFKYLISFIDEQSKTLGISNNINT